MSETEHANVIIPPPLLYVGTLAALFLLEFLRPLPLLGESIGRWMGAALVIGGLAVNLWGAASMIRARTPINPYRPVREVVAAGAFRVTRNPLYMGFNLIFLGVTFIVSSLWGVLLLVPLLLVMHYGVILREERYMEARFGESYRQYCSRVRRYF